MKAVGQKVNFVSGGPMEYRSNLDSQTLVLKRNVFSGRYFLQPKNYFVNVNKSQNGLLAEQKGQVYNICKIREESL